MGLRGVDVAMGVRSVRERYSRRKHKVRLQHQQMRLGAFDKVKIWARTWPKRYINLPMETTSIHMLLQEIEESEFIAMQDLKDREAAAIQRFESFGLVHVFFSAFGLDTQCVWLSVGTIIIFHAVISQTYHI